MATAIWPAATTPLLMTATVLWVGMLVVLWLWVLLAIPGLEPDAIDQFIADREAALIEVAQQGGDIKVVASTFLGPKERVLLLEVQDRQILVGVNPNCIQALGEFSSDAAPFTRALDEVRSA